MAHCSDVDDYLSGCASGTTGCAEPLPVNCNVLVLCHVRLPQCGQASGPQKARDSWFSICIKRLVIWQAWPCMALLVQLLVMLWLKAGYAFDRIPNGRQDPSMLASSTPLQFKALYTTILQKGSNLLPICIVLEKVYTMHHRSCNPTWKDVSTFEARIS
jgi:hypothetical protein